MNTTSMVIALAGVACGGALCLVIAMIVAVRRYLLLNREVRELANSLRKSVASAEKRLQRRAENSYIQAEAFANLLLLLQPNQSLPPMRASAIAPDLALYIADLILTHEPKVILELGSGVSTIVAAYALRRLGEGHIWSLDHERHYAAQTSSNLELHGLAAYATVLHAPLVPLELSVEKWSWYDPQRLKHVPHADLIFIDGPPRSAGVLTRYPAMPLLKDLMAPGARIVMDDADRDAERRTVQRWQDEFPQLEVSYLATEKGTVLASFVDET